MSAGDSPRTQQARTAALIRSSREPSGAAMTEKARATFRQSFYDGTDPALPAEERQRQADAAYRAHMRTIAQKSRGGRGRRRPPVPPSAEEQALRDQLRAELLAEFREVLQEAAGSLTADADAV